MRVPSARFKTKFQTIASIHVWILAITPLSADWRDEAGFTRLQLLAAAELPAAPGQGFSQIEATATDPPVYTFMPDTANPLFSGKTFTNKSATTGTAVSGHATHVATNFYGNTTSLITGNCPVDVYYANDWLNSQFLKFNTFNQPATESRAVENHSWVASTAGVTDTQAEEINRRLDYAIHRDGFVCVVGSDNNGSAVLPQLLCQSYHTISVGMDNGTHSAGFTNADGTGRTKPDIVGPSAAPENAASWATPMVSSAAALLYGKLVAAPYSLTGADKPRVIKALLLASATKIPIWANTSTRPLDAKYGAGILNIHHAYNDLRAGRAAASNSTAVNPRGWAAETVNGSAAKTYFFTIAPGAPSTPFCSALTWHRDVSKSGFNTWTSNLANLNLRLYHASDFTLGTLVAESLSPVDNVELVYQAALAPGGYALVVENTSVTATPYALAWHSLPVVTITATQNVAREMDLQAGLITVSRTGDTTLPLLVPLTVTGSAIAGTHYQALPASVTIPAGQAAATVQVIPVADSLAQSDRTVTVEIAADFASVRDASQSATVTIQDKPYDAWRFANFAGPNLENPVVSSETADPDNDGLPNLIEYALALDPNVSGVSPVIGNQTDGYLSITAVKNTAATDISWSAEVTDDLGNWQPAVATDTLGNFSARDSVLIADAPRRFIRLKVTRP